MVGVRALGLVCNDPQRAQIALHAISSQSGTPLVELPGQADDSLVHLRIGGGGCKAAG